MRNLIFTFLTLLLVVLASCSDKPSEPVDKGEPYYQLTYMYTFPEAVVLTLNTRTGELIDSAWYPSAPYWDFEFSQDGELMYCTGGATWIVNTTTGDTLAIDHDRSGKPMLAPGEEFLAVSSATRMSVFKLPSLTLLFEKDAPSIWATFHPTRNLMYYTDGYSPAYDADTVHWLDLTADPLQEHAVALMDTLGEPYPAGPVTVSGDGQWLLVCYAWELLLLDTDSLKTRRMFRNPDHWGHFWPAASDYEKNKVYLGYVDSPLFYPEDGGIDVFDFNSQTLTSLVDKTMNPGLPGYMAPYLGLLSPNNKELFGINVTEMGGAKGIFKVNILTKEIEVFLPERAGYPNLLKINPKPFYD